jgi:hypothetical protein
MFLDSVKEGRMTGYIKKIIQSPIRIKIYCDYLAAAIAAWASLTKTWFAIKSKYSFTIGLYIFANIISVYIINAGKNKLTKE